MLDALKADLGDLRRLFDRTTWLLAANFLLLLVILVRLSYIDL